MNQLFLLHEMRYCVSGCFPTLQECVSPSPLRFEGSFFMDIEPMKIRVPRPFEIPGTTYTARQRHNTEEPSARLQCRDNPQKNKELSVLLSQYVHRVKQQTLSLAQDICIWNKEHDRTYTEFLLDTGTNCWLLGVTATPSAGEAFSSIAPASSAVLSPAELGI